MNFVKLHTKIPKYNEETDEETWPDEWREEYVDLSRVERLYVASIDVFDGDIVALCLASGNRIFVMEPLKWIVDQLGVMTISEYVPEKLEF